MYFFHFTIIIITKESLQARWLITNMYYFRHESWFIFFSSFQIDGFDLL